MVDTYDAYRRTLTSAEGGDTAWWYLGTTTVQPEGHPEFIVNHVETVMIYRAEPLPEGQRVRWWEIGAFRDAITGEEPSVWVNPMTGAVNPAPKLFEEGPSAFSLRPDGNGGAELFDAVQAHAQYGTATIEARTIGQRVCITQIERKVRSFPTENGLPDLDAGQGSQATTVLQWFADSADLASGAPSVPATGYYSLEIGCPAWLGFGDIPAKFMVKGIMQKASLAPPLNPRGWDRLKAAYPHYFDGDTILPNLA